jgi:hypothetical protein
MSKRFSIICVVTFLGLAMAAILYAASEPAKPKEQSAEIKELWGQISKLTARVEQLEKRQRELDESQKRATAKLAFTEQPRTLATPVSPSQSIPEGWVPKKINGLDYYIVPLSPAPATVGR